ELALSRGSHDAARDGVLDLAADLVERLPDLEVDRRRALAAGQGHSGRIGGFPRALLRNSVDPSRAPARGARHLAVDRDGALDDYGGLPDVCLAAAVEVLALLLGEEEAPENLLGRGGAGRKSEQESYEKKPSCNSDAVLSGSGLGSHFLAQAGLTPLTEIRSTWHSARRRGCTVVAPGAAPRSIRVTVHFRTDTCALMPACRSARKFKRSPSCSSSMTNFNRLTTKSAALVATSPG